MARRDRLGSRGSSYNIRIGICRIARQSADRKTSCHDRFPPPNIPLRTSMSARLLYPLYPPRAYQFQREFFNRSHTDNIFSIYNCLKRLFEVLHIQM